MTAPGGPEVGAGELCVRTPAGGGPLPLRHTTVHATVSGQVAQVTVEQQFQNSYARPIEVVYVFPLPHEAAVHDFEIRIGPRVVRGEIHARAEAQAIYAQARREGRFAALLDQERPNIFQQSVANIMPGPEIVVRLQYVERLDSDDRGYSLVVPTVVGPRYIPGHALPTGAILPVGTDVEDVERGSRQGTGWAPDTDRVPDASRFTPPVLPPGVRSGHDIDITVDLDAAVPLGLLRCESHAVDVTRRGRSTAAVRLRPSDSIPNKDFVLRWETAGEAPEFGLLCYRDPQREREGSFALHLQPQAVVTPGEARPKEMIFLLDTSGSMRGEPIAKVKSAVRWALQHMNLDDTFQIIRFSDRASSLAPLPVPNTPAQVEGALAYLEALQGGGGTEMRAGIEAALNTPADPERLRLVFFMTDGYIGNDNEIIALVRQRLGAARLFAFGVGSSVNRFLLDRVAEEGRGSVDYVLLHEDTRAVVERFYARIAKPRLTDLRLTWEGVEPSDLEPAPLPDLYAGTPLVVTGRYAEPGRGKLVVSGRLGRRSFRREIAVDFPARATDDEGIALLWARQRIDALSSRMLDGGHGDLERQITDLALRFRLVSAYTSFVAVDNQVLNASGEPELVAQPVPMPAGVSYEGVFGDVTQEREVERSRGFSGHRAGSMPMLDAAPAPRHLRQAMSSSKSSPAALPGEPPRQEATRGDEDKPSLPEIAPSGVELSVEPLRRALRRGEVIELRITLRNRGGAALAVPARPDWRDGSLVVLVDGVPLPRGRHKFGPVTMDALAASAARTWCVILEKLDGTGPHTFEVWLAALGPSVTGRCTLSVR